MLANRIITPIIILELITVIVMLISGTYISTHPYSILYATLVLFIILAVFVIKTRNGISELGQTKTALYTRADKETETSTLWLRAISTLPIFKKIANHRHELRLIQTLSNVIIIQSFIVGLIGVLYTLEWKTYLAIGIIALNSALLIKTSAKRAIQPSATLACKILIAMIESAIKNHHIKGLNYTPFGQNKSVYVPITKEALASNMPIFKYEKQLRTFFVYNSEKNIFEPVLWHISKALHIESKLLVHVFLTLGIGKFEDTNTQEIIDYFDIKNTPIQK